MRRYAERVRPLTAWVLVVLASQGGCQGKLPPAHDTSPFGAPKEPGIAAGAIDRGRRIYTMGRSPVGRPITARIGDGPAVPAAALPCVQCHGEDGRGRPEGDVTPANIAWSALTPPYGLTRPDGQNRPPYSPALFARAIALGFDSAGRPLGPTMPRYQIDAADAADLVAFLRRLDDGPADAGVSADLVRIGLAPGLSPLASRAVAAAIEVVNRGGGVFRRRLELVADAVSDDVFAVIDVAPAVPWPDGGHAGVGAAPVVGFQPDPWVETGGESGARARPASWRRSRRENVSGSRGASFYCTARPTAPRRSRGHSRGSFATLGPSASSAGPSMKRTPRPAAAQSCSSGPRTRRSWTEQ